MHGGEVLFLSGDLGAGKTTFTQAIGRGLGVVTNITSPTFNVIKEYTVLEKDLMLVHADMYRLASEADLVSVGLQEIIGQNKIITIIEWPEKIAELEKIPHLHLTFQDGVVDRQLVLELHGDSKPNNSLWNSLNENALS